MEAVITLAMVLKKFDVELAMKPEDVGIYTGDTIHTRNGLHMHVKERVKNSNSNSNSDDNSDSSSSGSSRIQDREMVTESASASP